MASPKNFGEQIHDAVQDAVGSQDFSKLQQTIEQSINIAAANIGKGIAQAQESYRQTQAEAAAKAAADHRAPIPPDAAVGAKTRERHLDSQRRARERAVERSQRAMIAQQENALYTRTGARLAGSICMIVFGALALLVFTPLAISTLVLGFFVSAGVLGALALAGLVATVVGIVKTSFLGAFSKYRKAIGVCDYRYIKDIAAVTGDAETKVLARLKKMLRKGLFQQAALDDDQTMIIMTSACFEQYRQAQQLELKRKRQERIADSVTQEQETAPLNAEQKVLLARGEAYIAKIRLSNEAIPGEEISRKIDQIEDVVRIIFKRAAEQPQVIADLGQLMDYYLPTTVKLLDAYRELDAQPIQGDNIVQSKREIEGALDSLATAFEKLLDSIFRDMAWDVSSDVSVLHTVLAQEGLVDSPFATQEKLA